MAADTVKIDIRTRRTLKPDWSEEESTSVPCPVSGTSTRVEECRECQRNAGVVRDPSGHWFVVCRMDPTQPEPRRKLKVAPHWEHARVADVMTADTFCVQEDVALSEVVALFVERGISGAPVVDGDGRPLGVVSKTDVLMEDYERVEEAGGLLSGREGPHATQVRDVMTRGSVCLPESATLLDAVLLMAAEDVHRLPVVDAEGVVVGVLSTLDVVRALAAHAR